MARLLPPFHACMRLVITRPSLLTLTAALGAFALACGQTPKPTIPAGSPLAGPRLAESRVAITPEAPRSAASCGLDTVYFTYDSALLDDAARNAVIAAVPCYQRQGTPAQLLLRGATDPRGTEDYNLALGQRRAVAVRNLLITLGIPPARISVTSAGEEHATGLDENGWRLDRHVAAASQ